MSRRSELSRALFFENQVHNENWKKTMAGKNEDKVLEVLLGMGYIEGVDFVRQHPVGNRFVLDFAFVKEQVAVEVDGDNHKTAKAKKLDKARDAFLIENNWGTIRIYDKEFFGYKASFYKNLIREVVKERREQWEIGELYAMDFNSFEEENYDYR